MVSLRWVAGTWAVLILVAALLSRRFPRIRPYLRRENIGLLIALLGTYSLAPVVDAEEVLREPVIAERIARGALAAVALLITGPLLVSRLRSGLQVGHRAMAGIVIYIGVGLVSTVYSAAPLVSAAKIFEISAGLVPILAVAYGPEPRRRLGEMLVVVVIALTSLLSVGVLGFFLLPTTFAYVESRPGFLIRETLFAPFAHSNTISGLGAIVGVFALARALRSVELRALWWSAFVITTAALVLASGRQGVAMFLAGVIVVLFIERRRLFMFALGPAALTVFWTYQEEIVTALARNRPQSFTTLTGRIGFWEAAIVTWSEHPWTGWGFGSGGRFVVLNSIGRGYTSSLHSGFFEALTGVGLLGIIPLAYVLYRVVKWSLGAMRARTDLAAAVLIIPLSLRTGVSLGFGGWLTVEFAMFAILAALSDQSLRLRLLPRVGREDRPKPAESPVLEQVGGHLVR